MVTMRLGHGQSQWENAAFPQFSSVFMGEMPIFAGILAIGPLKPAIGAGLAGFDVGVLDPAKGPRLWGGSVPHLCFFAATVGNPFNSGAFISTRRAPFFWALATPQSACSARRRRERRL
jgi:hypothetical protein